MPLYKLTLSKIVNKFPERQVIYYDCADKIELLKIIQKREDWERVTQYDVQDLASDEDTGAAVIHRATVADG